MAIDAISHTNKGASAPLAKWSPFIVGKPFIDLAINTVHNSKKGTAGCSSLIGLSRFMVKKEPARTPKKNSFKCIRGLYRLKYIASGDGVVPFAITAFTLRIIVSIQREIVNNAAILILDFVNAMIVKGNIR